MKRTTSGFTLLEISIVLAIIAVVLGGGLVAFSQSVAARQLSETQQKIAAIQDALLKYRVAYGRIPCPGDLTIVPSAANFGAEGQPAGNCLGSGGVTPVANFSYTSGNSAVFVKTDTTTQGSWIGTYGADGYSIYNNTTSYPSYISSVNFASNSTFTWAASTSDVRALQKASNPSDRIAACWYSGSSFSATININDGKAHQVALYMTDWDTTVRIQTIVATDASNGTVLDTRTVSASFNGGQYWIWTVSGSVKFTFSKVGGANAVLNGIFFANTTSTSFAEGIVPTKTLRLPDGYAFDGWGRRIMYAVDTNFTANNAFSSIALGDATGRLAIKDASGAARVKNAAYVLLSSGANGHGAYPRVGGGTRIKTNSANTDELENCDCNSSAVSTGLNGTFVQKMATQDAATANRTNDFDDIVAYGTRMSLRSPLE